MPTSESEPSIQILREVENIEKLWPKVGESVVAENGIRDIKLNDKLRSNVIAPGELRAFHDNAGIVLTHEGAVCLADFLDENLPASVDEDLKVDTWPWAVHSSRKSNHPKRLTLTIGISNQLVGAERLAAQELIRQYYKLPKNSPEWLENDYVTHIHLARFRGEERAEMVEKFAYKLMETGIFPKILALSPVIIEDV